MIGQDISNIRKLIKKVQNDSLYEDQFLYSLLSICASKLQYQRIEKYKRINDFNWFTFCVRLEKVKSHDCDCVEIGCDVLKTVITIPRPMVARNELLLKVETLGDVLIPPKSPQIVKDDNLDDIKRGKPGWHIRNEKVIIWNNLKYKAIQISGIWEDISKWQGKELCDLEGNVIANCETVLDQSLPLDEHLRFDAYKMVLSLLRIPLSVMDDITVDNNPEIKI